jgi:hypothetical protein
MVEKSATGGQADVEDLIEALRAAIVGIGNLGARRCASIEFT